MNPDGIVWVIDPVALILLSLFVLCLFVLISVDWIEIHERPGRPSERVQERKRREP